MLKKRWYFWSLLFLTVLLTVGALATGWNVFLFEAFKNYHWSLPAFRMGAFLGAIGFVTVLGITLLFFVRLFQEMRLNQLQTEFLARVTHELKSPLATLELSADLLKKGGLPKQEEESLWKSHQSELVRLKEEVDALLDAARWQRQQPQPNLQPLSLEAWINESVVRWKKILGPGCELIRKGDELKSLAQVDRRLLDLIANNLVTNTRKYAMGRPILHIETEIADSERSPWEKKWSIHFRDQGAGFEPQDSKKIFRLFFRSQKGKAIPGAGLGLHLARTAARAQKLQLSGSSEGHGKGAVFSLSGTYPLQSQNDSGSSGA